MSKDTVTAINANAKVVEDTAAAVMDLEAGKTRILTKRNVVRVAKYVALGGLAIGAGYLILGARKAAEVVVAE